MKYILPLILFLAIAHDTFAQKDQPNKATVIVSVTDRKFVPAEKEEILFRGKNTGTIIKGLTGKDGKFSIDVPVGDQYLVNVKSLNDTTTYGIIDIPKPPPGQFYAEPFKVDIEYEPARRYTLDNVHFDFGKASLRQESFVELNELFIYLQRKPHISVEIAGHTDNVGKDEDNLKLSIARANSIRNYILKKGIQPTRVIAKGYGATQPVADNDSPEGRQLNRRTEVIIQD